MVLLIVAYLTPHRDFVITATQLSEDAYAWLLLRPSLLFVALCILPGLGFPVSPILFAFAAIGGASWGIFPTCVLAVIAMTVNMLWTYPLAAFFFRNLFQKFLESKKDLIPDNSGRSLIILAIAIRITPGVPFFFQNYFLGFLRMPFLEYIGVGLAVQVLLTPAWIICGASLATGNLKWFLFGASLLLFLSFLTNIMRNKLKRGNEALPSKHTH